jgi:beta-galactosidase
MGTVIDDKLLARLVNELIAKAGLAEYGLLPSGLEVCTRSNSKAQYVFVINHGSADQQLSISGLDLLSGHPVDGRLNLAAGDVAVVKVSR